METNDSNKMVFNSGSVIKATLSNGVYTPVNNIVASPGQIMIFEANGAKAMVYYNGETGEWRAM